MTFQRIYSNLPYTLSNSEYDLTRGGGINAYFYFYFDRNLHPLLCPTKAYPTTTPHQQVK